MGMSLLQKGKVSFCGFRLQWTRTRNALFSSLYSCKCLKNTYFTTEKDKNVFHYTPINNREDEKTSLADTNNFLESFTK